jgi:hypothetical protein
MSADEFDPAIERLFGRTPELSDSQAFEMRVMGRLQSNTRVRAMILSSAGLIGGIVAVKELAGVQLKMGEGRFEASTDSGGQSVGTALREGSVAVQGMMDNMGLGGVEMGSVNQAETFLGVVVVLLTLLTMGVVKLYQQV